jgi:hypothetical protein
MQLKERLAEKGWSKSEINKTLRIIENAKKNKHPIIKILDSAVYWFSLMVAIVGNFMISIALIPMLLALKSIQLYVVIITLALSFGLLFELLIRTIELRTSHHVFLGILIPIIALLNFIFIVLVSNRIEVIISVGNHQNPILVGIWYSIAFMLPYSFYQIFLKNRS